MFSNTKKFPNMKFLLWGYFTELCLYILLQNYECTFSSGFCLKMLGSFFWISSHKSRPASRLVEPYIEMEARTRRLPFFEFHSYKFLEGHFYWKTLVTKDIGLAKMKNRRLNRQGCSLVAHQPVDPAIQAQTPTRENLFWLRRAAEAATPTKFLNFN